MNLATYLFQKSSGWNAALDSKLDSKNTLVIVFGPPNVEQFLDAIEKLHKAFSSSLIIGCSTAGEIYSDEIFDNSLSVAVTQFEKTSIQLASTKINDLTSKQVGKDIAEQLINDKLKSVFILSDGLNVNGTSLVNGISKELGQKIIITGGLAGDGARFEQTWILKQGEILTNIVVAVGFYGEYVQFYHGSRGGWDALGIEREVTHSDANVLYELDGQPALKLYKKYLGERADDLPSSGLLFPLAIKNSEEVDGVTVRTILGIDEQQQSITFAGDIPQGSFVQLMYANFDRLVEGAYTAAEMIDFSKLHSTTVLSIAISCVGRRLVLGQRSEEETEAILEVFPDNAKQIGFYSYGEISPLSSGRCDLHNQTMTLTVISEN